MNCRRLLRVETSNRSRRETAPFRVQLEVGQNCGLYLGTKAELLKQLLVCGIHSQKY